MNLKNSLKTFEPRKRRLGRATALTVAFALAPAAPASAHFPWVLADKGVARIILSETLAFDYAVDADLVSKVSLSFRGPDDKERALKVRKDKLDYVVDVPGPGTVFGTLDLGLMKRGESTHVLVYFPKTIVGSPFGKEARTVSAPVEFVLAGTAEAPRLKLLVEGKPLPQSEVLLVLPNDTQKTVKTDDLGLTEPLVLPGRYGAWARHWVKQSGERAGTAYSEVRRYATVVFDLPAAAKQEAAQATVSSDVVMLSRLPQATSSFGAAIDAGWLYVYGGHITPTHDYSKDAVSGAFHRYNIASKRWESLPGGSAVQGMNLAIHNGKVYRVGGMRPENDPGQPPDTRSRTDAARFDVATKQWETLPPLPTPRSSHELAVVGDKVYAIGGWNMRGPDSSVWADAMGRLDLSASPSRWESIPQPFKRRAIITAVRGSQVYVIGGFDENDVVIDSVDVYDVARETWSKGPSLPKGSRNGFAPAAATLDGQIFISLGDGGVYRLNEVSTAWERVATTTKRIAHRMVADGSDRLLLLGGAANGDNLDLLEMVTIRPNAAVASRKD